MKISMFVGSFLLATIYLISIGSALNESQIIQLALDQFNKKVPDEYKHEFPDYIVETSHGTTTRSYFITWQRKINGLPIHGDKFVVIIDEDGSFINTGDLKYSYPSSVIDITYSVNKDQAKWVINNAYNGTLTQEPALAIVDGKLAWQMQMDLSDGKTHIWIDIDAKSGETIRFTQSRGSSVSQIPTKFDPTRYFLQTQLPWIIGVLALIGVGSFIYYKRWPK